MRRSGGWATEPVQPLFRSRLLNQLARLSLDSTRSAKLHRFTVGCVSRAAERANAPIRSGRPASFEDRPSTLNARRSSYPNRWRPYDRLDRCNTLASRPDSVLIHVISGRARRVERVGTEQQEDGGTGEIEAADDEHGVCSNVRDHANLRTTRHLARCDAAKLPSARSKTRTVLLDSDTFWTRGLFSWVLDSKRLGE